jgi:O-antigen ligase
MAFLIALGGLSVLGYGFANVPALPSLPLPLVDVLLAGAFVGLVLTGARWPVPRAPFVLAALLFAWASIRLLIDFPTWGSLAWRDYTTYVELSAVFVGYWLMERVGLHRWTRALSWIFAAVVAYGLVKFQGSIFSTFNITVGIQQPIALLGSMSGVASVSAFFFFALVRPIGSFSLVLAALSIPPILVSQMRGLYVVLPLTIMVLLLTGLVEGRAPLVRRLLVATIVTVVAASAVLAAQPNGRFGKTNPGLIRDQIMTLAGGSGVGSGSIDSRTQWFTETIGRLRVHPDAIAYGLGLGPDLTDGFTAGKSILVRKPHNDYLEVLARLGLTGLLLFLMLIVTALKPIVVWSRFSTPTGEKGFQMWVFANTIVYLFISATQPLLAFPYGTIPLFGALGAGLALGCSPRIDRGVE